MKQSPSDRCSRCGFFGDPLDMILVVWPDGSDRLLCLSCFSILLKNKRIRLVGHRYFLKDSRDGNQDSALSPQGDIINKVSEILGYEAGSEAYSKGFLRHIMLKEARELGMVPWIMPEHEFHGRAAEAICKKVIRMKKQQDLRDALRGASDNDDREAPDHNDPDLV